MVLLEETEAAGADVEEDDEAFLAAMLAQQAAEDKETEPEEPSALEYVAACTNLKCLTKCSQWMRACNSRASEVLLCHYGVGKFGSEPLARSLTLNSNVTNLDLGDNGLGSEGISHILKALQQPSAAPSLSVLSLRQNQAGEEGAEALRALLVSNAHALASIDFGANAIGNKGGEVVAEGLGRNTTVTSLSLEHNDIEEVEKLAHALRANSTLTAFSLEWNQVAPGGGKLLADAISSEPSLTSLNLGWNGLGDAGVKSLSAAIEQCPPDGPLRDVRLHHNRMSAEAAVPLSRALGNLDVLDTSGNALGEGGAAVLLMAQQELRLRNPLHAPTGEDATPRCKLIMEDVCVRPDTALAGLLMRAARGEEVAHDEMQRGGVLAAAAPTLAAAAPPKLGKGGAKKAGKSGDADWRRTNEPSPRGQLQGAHGAGGAGKKAAAKKK